MKLRKESFFITINAAQKGAKTFEPLIIEKSGYIATMFDSEMATPFEVGVYKNGNLWVVTCLLTGYMINQGKTRKAALENFERYHVNKYRAYVRRNDSAFSAIKRRYEAMISDYAGGAS